MTTKGAIQNRKRLAVALICAALAISSGVAYTHYVDWPEGADPMPGELISALGSNVDRIGAFYRYDLGGFIDSEELWRVEADEPTLQLLASGLNLQAVDTVPNSFLRMPPHYWPRRVDSTFKSFAGPGFKADARGEDGQHYFMLMDTSRHTAFVWYKNNF